MSRHVDESHPVSADVGISEAEIDGQPAALLLGERIRVDTRQGLNEGRFAVIDVTGGDDDHRPWEENASS